MVRGSESRVSGVAAKGYDMSHVIACDVLMNEGEESSSTTCTEDKRFQHEDEHIQDIAINIKTHAEDNFKVTTEQLERINTVIGRYDCNFVHLRNRTNFRLLHGHFLQDIWDHQCNNEALDSNDRLTSRQKLAAKIKVEAATPRKMALRSPTENASTTRTGATAHSNLSLVFKYDPTIQDRHISMPASTMRHEKAGLGMYCTN